MIKRVWGLPYFNVFLVFTLSLKEAQIWQRMSIQLPTTARCYKLMMSWETIFKHHLKYAEFDE